MRKIVTLAALLGLSACATTPNTPHAGVQALSDGSYLVREIDYPLASVAERAASYCGYFGQRVEVVASSTQYGLFTDRNHAVLTFRCV